MLYALITEGKEWIKRWMKGGRMRRLLKETEVLDKRDKENLANMIEELESDIVANFEMIKMFLRS